MSNKINIIKTLKERGIFDRISDESLVEIVENEPITVYCGFDPSSDSLHIGNLVAILCLKRFQMAGHRPIALVGGATGLIGDPSGKKDERQLLSKEQVQANVDGIRRVLSKFLSFEGENAAVVVNNIDWIGAFSFIDFIRDVGKHVRITEMLARESVKARLDSGAGMSYTEFTYQILQAYDFYHLNTQMNCCLQIGGSDQWGNITAGTDLIRRISGNQAFGLVYPLLLNAQGQKFGKSESGAVWLTADKTSPYQFYQFWVRTDDRDVIQCLKTFTFLSLEQIAELEEKVRSKPEEREAQKTLAWEMTSLVHGEEEAWGAVEASQALFNGQYPHLPLATILEIFSDVPSFSVPRQTVEEGYPILDALVLSGMVSSKGEARRTLQGGGVYLNDQRVEGLDQKIGEGQLLGGKVFVLRMGKKNYTLGKVE